MLSKGYCCLLHVNIWKRKYKTQAKTGGLCRFRYERFINFLTSVHGDTRGGTQFLKAYAKHTMWFPLNVRCILWSLRSMSVDIKKKKKQTQTTCLYGRELNCRLNSRNLTVCLHGPISTDSFLKSSNSQDHLFRAWRHPDFSHIFCLGVYYDNGDCYILCARALNCTQCLFTWT